MPTKEKEIKMQMSTPDNKLPDKHVFSKLRTGIVFAEPVEFDTLSYMTDINSSEDIFQNGLALNKSEEYLWLMDEFNVDVGGILEVRPIKLNESKEESVKFSFSGLKFLALRKFYFLEILDYGELSMLKILVTHKTYPELKKFNPFLETKAPAKTGTLPIVFFKGNWTQYTSFSSLHGKKADLRVQLLLDTIPQQNIYCDYINKDTNQLIYIFQFFALLSKYHGSNGIVYRGDKTSLYKLITAIRQCHCDTGEVHTLPFMDKISTINNALFSINFGKAFDTGCIQTTDIKHVNAMDLIYLKTQTIPYPQTMINVIMKGITEMEKEDISFQKIFRTFLQHFLTQEAKLTVKSNIIAYLGSL